MTQICFSEVDRQVDRRAQASVASVNASHGLFIVRHPASNGRPQISTLPLCIYRQKESKGPKKINVVRGNHQSKAFGLYKTLQKQRRPNLRIGCLMLPQHTECLTTHQSRF